MFYLCVIKEPTWIKYMKSRWSWFYSVKLLYKWQRCVCVVAGWGGRACASTEIIAQRTGEWCYVLWWIVVQSLSHVWLCNPWTTARQASLSFTVSCSRWCCPTTSPSVILFCCPQYFPTSGSFPVSLLFTSGGQSTGASTSASVLLMNSQDWFPLRLTGLISSPCTPRDSQESSPTPQFESINSLVLSFLYGPTLTSLHDYWKNHSFD